MEHLTNTTPANDAGTHARSIDTSIDTSDATMSDQVAVCANGDVIPLTRGQNRGNIYETGAPISEQFGRADIAFVCSASMATRASVIARAAEHIARCKEQTA